MNKICKNYKISFINSKFNREECSNNKYHSTIVELIHSFFASWIMKSGIFVLLLCFINYPLWRFHGYNASLIITISYLIFTLADLAILIILPLLRISFGPIKQQLTIMNFPRILVSLVCFFIGFFTDYAIIIFFILQGMGTLSYFYGMIIEVSRLKINNIILKSKYIKSSIKIIHLSDIHMERLSKRDEKAISVIKKQKPDFILISGDYLNFIYKNDKRAKDDLINFLNEITANIIIVGTMGTPGIDDRMDITALFKPLNIKILRDSAALIKLEDGSKISLIGIDCDHNPKIDAEILNDLIRKVPSDFLKILIYHSPELMPLVNNHEIDLYLCGHTHGGQIRIPLYGAIITASKTRKSYEKGMYIENNTRLYVNSGLGLEGWNAPRKRLFCPAELAVFHIKPESD